MKNLECAVTITSTGTPAYGLAVGGSANHDADQDLGREPQIVGCVATYISLLRLSSHSAPEGAWGEGGVIFRSGSGILDHD